MGMNMVLGWEDGIDANNDLGLQRVSRLVASIKY